jgi:Uncharacterized protein conserved in bacteria
MIDVFKKAVPDAAIVQHLFDSTRGNLFYSNLDWFAAAGQMPIAPTPDVRQVAFYLGMQLEEVAEKLEAVLGSGSETAREVQALATRFKQREFDAQVADTLNNPKGAKALLDGDCDQVWVSIGSARAQGADVLGAYEAVDRANWNKRFPDGTFHLSEAGKVLKPEGWEAPDLSNFIHPSLRK